LLTGSIVYNLRTAQVIAFGISFVQEELDTALTGPVTDIVFDTEERARLTALIESATGTNFNPVTLQRILSSDYTPEDWRVGEALAEAYLIENYGCHFPWPDSRDERKAHSSLPGADLVGFRKDGSAHRFVFGEVKTSSDRENPPGTIYGRTGLKRQIEDLKEDLTIRDKLVEYLMHRIAGSSWLDRFIESYLRYTENSSDVQIFGILVRDVPPHQNDLHARITSLGRNCYEPMSILLCAFYLPENSIPTLSTTVVRAISQRGRT